MATSLESLIVSAIFSSMSHGGIILNDMDVDDTFFPGRRADIFYNNAVIGSFGIVHPSVLEKFEIKFPCTAIEINIEPFV